MSEGQKAVVTRKGAATNVAGKANSKISSGAANKNIRTLKSTGQGRSFLTGATVRIRLRSRSK